jgi:hypothetical protein
MRVRWVSLWRVVSSTVHTQRPQANPEAFTCQAPGIFVRQEAGSNSTTAPAPQHQHQHHSTSTSRRQHQEAADTRMQEV